MPAAIYDPKQTSGKSIRGNEIAGLFRDRLLEPVHQPVLDYRGNVETDEPFLGEGILYIKGIVFRRLLFRSTIDRFECLSGCCVGVKEYRSQ
jgi:hypothetical protein